MSVGCGTLASPSGFSTGIEASARFNGKQHTLPTSPLHSKKKPQDISDHWGPHQPKGTTRLWGSSTVKNRFGGEERSDSQPDFWKNGEYWNVDSNITKWGTHEVKRNAAAANHDVHRHDQIKRLVLAPHPNPAHSSARHQRIPARQSTTGMWSPDSFFLEAWGFDLGSRDRHASPITTPAWRPVGGGATPEHFRSTHSYSRNVGRMAEHYRSMRRQHSAPSMSSKGERSAASSMPHSPASLTLRPEELVPPRPEDIGGDAGELSTMEDKMIASMGRSYGTRSCTGYNDHGHAVKREAAKMSLSIHSPILRTNRDNIPYVEGRLAPAGIYRRTHIQSDSSA